MHQTTIAGARGQKRPLAMGETDESAADSLILFRIQMLLHKARDKHYRRAVSNRKRLYFVQKSTDDSRWKSLNSHPLNLEARTGELHRVGFFVVEPNVKTACFRALFDHERSSHPDHCQRFLRPLFSAPLQWKETRVGQSLSRLSYFLRLAAPKAAEAINIESVLMSLQDEVASALVRGDTMIDVLLEHPLAAFLKLAREHVAAKSKHWQLQTEIQNVRLIIRPEHIEAFNFKLAALFADGRPWEPCLGFHDTPHEDAFRGIAASNFDPERCGRHDPGYYGRGTYFHTNIPQGGSGGSKSFLALLLKGCEYELGYRLGCPLQHGYD